MSGLILFHVVTGLLGIAAGAVVVGGIFVGKRATFAEAVFFATTAAACGSGFVFLPSDGVTSAQLVSFVLIALLGVAAYARYGQRCAGGWNPVYALAIVGALFLNMLITIAQSFLHVNVLKTLAPTQQSPVFVGVKAALLLGFVLLAIAAARRASRS